MDLILPLDNADEIARYARQTLRNSGAIGKLPTPIDDLLSSAKIDEIRIDDDVKERFLSRLPGATRSRLVSILQKVRGIADLRERVVYVDETQSHPRVLFTKGHELGHEILPWHKLDPALFDDDKSLSCEAEEDFDIEANLFAAEIIFQGDRFTTMVRDYAPGFDTIFQLAKVHGASRHATSRRYIESQDEPVALLTYWPSRYELQILWRAKSVGSAAFRKRFGGISVPQRLTSDHPWAGACQSAGIHRDQITLVCDSTTEQFQWEAWWNGYALFVLLRRKPILYFIRDIKDKVAAFHTKTFDRADV
jgi:hypothetical protein